MEHYLAALYMSMKELIICIKAGLDLVVAINSATINPAKYCKCADRKGSLEEVKMLI